MNVEEQIEKAFKAGAEFAIEQSYAQGDEDSVAMWFPGEREIETACTEYINNEALLNGNG